jgi:uncharacterized coiled-coil protein SlyX
MDDQQPDRIEKLEAALTHLERQYDELNAIVIRQDKQLARLTGIIDRVDSALHNLEMDEVRANNPRPPHYGDSALA